MDELTELLKKAVRKAIEEVGLENFKKTSMFGSNEQREDPFKGFKLGDSVCNKTDVGYPRYGTICSFYVTTDLVKAYIKIGRDNVVTWNIENIEHWGIG